MSLKIGIDASGLAAQKAPTGLQRYLGSLLPHLIARAESDDLRLALYFSHPVPEKAYAPDKPLANARPSAAVQWRVAPIARGWQRLGLGIAMRLDRLDVFHFPAPVMAGFCPVPAVVTFHDLAALSLEAEQTEKERRYLPASLDAGRRAASLIAVSRSAADEVTRYLKRNDVHFIPEGVDRTQFYPIPNADEIIRANFGFDCYLLCVGTLQTRKNHLRLIHAFEQIQDSVPHTLVIAGGDGSGAEALKSYLAANPNPRIKMLGYVDDSLLPALYTAADALALPSLWEGFGLPLIEAMASGTPVLTSNTSSLVEVAEDAAVIVDPRDINAIADGLLRLLTDDNLRAQLIALGSQRAAQWSWEAAARETIAVYREAAERRH